MPDRSLLALMLPLVSTLLLTANSGASAEELSDPTRPSSYSARASTDDAPSPASLKLTLIRLGAAPLAVINGKSVSPGESIGGYRLLSLRANSATLGAGGEPVILTLNSTLPKSPAKR